MTPVGLCEWVWTQAVSGSCLCSQSATLHRRGWLIRFILGVCWLMHLTPHGLLCWSPFHFSGSHNAITYCLDTNNRSPIDLKQPDMLQTLDKFMKPIIRPFLYKWAVTQVKCATQLQWSMKFYYLIIITTCGALWFICIGTCLIALKGKDFNW